MVTVRFLSASFCRSAASSNIAIAAARLLTIIFIVTILVLTVMVHRHHQIDCVSHVCAAGTDALVPLLQHKVYPQDPYFGRDASCQLSTSSHSPEHGHVRYHHNLCLNMKMHQWHSSSRPSPHWPGVNIGVHAQFRGSMGWHGPILYVPRDLFNPSLAPPSVLPQTSFDLMVRPVVLLYIWVDHFGHALMDQVFPAFLTMKTFGLTTNRSHDNVDVVLIGDARTHYKWALPLSNLIGNSHTIHDLRRASDSGIVCFNDAVVGMKRNSVNHANFQDTKLGDYQAFRDFVLSGKPFLANDCSPRNLIVVFKKLANRRRLMNLDVLVQRITSFFGTQWDVQVKVMETLSLEEQICLVSSARVHVSVASTESHFAMFLPNGGVSIVMMHPLHEDVNKAICDTSSGLIACLQLPAQCTEKCNSLWSDINVDLTALPQIFSDASKFLNTDPVESP